MYATINITPRAFGNIAARAITYGLDVSAYLVRTAITAPAPEPPAAPAAPTSGAGQGSAPESPAADYTENTEPPNLTC